MREEGSYFLSFHVMHWILFHSIIYGGAYGEDDFRHRSHLTRCSLPFDATGKWSTLPPFCASLHDSKSGHARFCHLPSWCDRWCLLSATWETARCLAHEYFLLMDAIYFHALTFRARALRLMMPRIWPIDLWVRGADSRYLLKKDVSPWWTIAIFPGPAPPPARCTNENLQIYRTGNYRAHASFVTSYLPLHRALFTRRTHAHRWAMTLKTVLINGKKRAPYGHLWGHYFDGPSIRT